MKFLSVKMLWIVTTGLVGGVLLMLLMHRDQTGTRTPVPGQAVPRSFEAPVEKDRASAIMVRDMDFTLRNMQGQNPSAPAEAVKVIRPIETIPKIFKPAVTASTVPPASIPLAQPSQVKRISSKAY